MSIRIFVYGSLKPDEFNYSVCADRVVSTEPAIAQGTLYHLPLGYPAMTTGNTPIHGYILTFADAEILPILDTFETHDRTELQKLFPDLKENCDYDRHLIDTFTPDAQFFTQAWAYLMTITQITQIQGILIPSGNWTRKKYP